jgi:hypothetical protein
MDMRLRSKLFYVFLTVLLVVASIVEASKGGKKKRNRKGDRGKKPVLAIPSGSDGGTLVERNSGPSLESEKTKDNKTNAGEASKIVEGDGYEIVPFAVSGSDTEGNDVLGKEFGEELRIGVSVTNS